MAEAWPRSSVSKRRRNHRQKTGVPPLLFSRRFAPRACKDGDAGESSLLSFPLFSFLSDEERSEAEREREMEDGAERGEKRRGQ